jgi:hypothetical protein
LYYCLKESKKGTGEGGEPTIADIKRLTKWSITRDAKAELCRMYFGTSVVESNTTILSSRKKKGVL